MKVVPLTFYHILKNEDAYPFYLTENRGGLMAVADGLGGSGSFVHRLSDEDNERLQADLEMSVLPETLPEEGRQWDYFRHWVKYLLEPMKDGNPDTSALWGSRVAVIRYVYYMLKNSDVSLSDERERQKIADFIYSGIEKTAKEFDLKTDMPSHAVLPTTLVSIKYSYKEDGKINAEVVWAGDSRAYAYIPGEGLKQLSEDDENSSGGITNLFCLKDGAAYNTHLNYKSYALPSKCLLFVCSDGLFDPYSPIDNTAMEAVLLDCITRSESFDQFRLNWSGHYEPLKHDDCSASLGFVGYDSFSEVKEACASRYKKVIELFNGYYEYRKIIPVLKGQENPEEYVNERACQRKTDIADIIAGELLCNPATRESVVLPYFKEIYHGINKRYAAQYIKDCNRVNKKIAENLKKYFLKNYENALNGILSVKAARPELYRMYNLAMLCREAACDSRLKEILDRGNAIVTEIREKIKEQDRLLQCFEKTDNIITTEVLSNVQFLSKYIKKAGNIVIKDKERLQQIIEMWNRKRTELFVKGTPNLCMEYYSGIRAAILDYSGCNGKYERAIDKYKECVRNIPDDALIKTIHTPENYYSEEVLSNVDFTVNCECKTVERSELTGIILDTMNNNPPVFETLLNNLIDSEEETIIDKVFNPGRLRTCRLFRKVNTEKVKEVIRDIEELEKESVTVYNKIKRTCL